MGQEVAHWSNKRTRGPNEESFQASVRRHLGQGRRRGGGARGDENWRIQLNFFTVDSSCVSWCKLPLLLSVATSSGLASDVFFVVDTHVCNGCGLAASKLREAVLGFAAD